MTLFEQLMAIRTGGGVERCHGILHQGSYSVAAHTWGMLSLLYLLWPNDFARLAPYAMFHDVPEAWVGDIPASTKKWCPEVKVACTRMESQIFERLDLPDDSTLGPEDKAKLRACDSLELYLWAKEQVTGGNQHADCIRRELESFYERDPLPYQAGILLYAIQQGSVEHATDQVIREINGVV